MRSNGRVNFPTLSDDSASPVSVTHPNCNPHLLHCGTYTRRPQYLSVFPHQQRPPSSPNPPIPTRRPKDSLPPPALLRTNCGAATTSLEKPCRLTHTDVRKMPSSTITSAQKSLIEAALPKTNHKKVASGLARLYFAYPNPSSWTYSGIQGGIVLAFDRLKNAWFLRMVDLVGTRGIVWEHEAYAEIDSASWLDRPFFLTFAGDVRSPYLIFIRIIDVELKDCMVAIVFAEDHDAHNFHRKLVTRREVEGASTRPTIYP